MDASIEMVFIITIAKKEIKNYIFTKVNASLNQKVVFIFSLKAHHSSEQCFPPN